MTSITTKDVAELRGETGAGVMACRQALQDAGGDATRARELIRERGEAQAARRAGRELKGSHVASYNHGGRVVGVVELLSETDFVSRNEGFVELANRLAEQVAAMAPADRDELLAQAWIRQPEMTVGELVAREAARFGERVEVGEMVRVEAGS